MSSNNNEGKMLREIRIKTSETNIKKIMQFVESLKADSIPQIIYTKVLTREEVMDEFLEKLNRVNAEYSEYMGVRK
jgi:uncharacterized protein involved in tolerance to divalent cations